MTGRAKELSQNHEEQAKKEIAGAIKTLSTKIKELATATDVGISKRKRSRYSRKYELEGVKFQAIYFPRTPKTQTEDEKPEEFIIVKRRMSGQTPIFGYTFRITNDINNQETQNTVYVNPFIKHINGKREISAIDFDLKYEPIVSEYTHLMEHLGSEPITFVELEKGGVEQIPKIPRRIAGIDLINSMIGELSQIPLSA